jgi:hypothetical protein
MIIEPEISLRRREAVVGELRGAVFNGTNSDRACTHNRRRDSKSNRNQLLDGSHGQLRPADDRHHASPNGGN